MISYYCYFEQLRKFIP